MVALVLALALIRRMAESAVAVYLVIDTWSSLN